MAFKRMSFFVLPDASNFQKWQKWCNFSNILFHVSSSSSLESSESFPQKYIGRLPYYQPEKPDNHCPRILRALKWLEKCFPRTPLTQNIRLRLFVSRNPHFRRAALNLSSWQSSPCGALEVPNDFMNQENRSVLSKFEWLAWPSTADYAVSRLCVFLWIPWNPLEAVESRSRPCRVAVANVLGATKVFSVNLLYGFPARLLVFLVIRKNEIHADLSVGFGGGSSDKWTDHLLLLREVDKTNHEMEFVENWGEIRTNLIFVNQNRAETFIWQEIGSQIRKVYEILVRLVGATLHLNRKTVKYTRNHTFFRKIQESQQCASAFWNSF